MVLSEIQEALRIDRGWVEMTSLAVQHCFYTPSINGIDRQDLRVQSCSKSCVQQEVVAGVAVILWWYWHETSLVSPPRSMVLLR